MAVQIARYMGAHVTAVCSARNADLVRSLGAETVIDYETTDIGALSERFDVIMDNHGSAPYARMKPLLKPGGRFLMVIGTMWELSSARFRKNVVVSDHSEDAFNTRIYSRLVDLAARGAIRPVIGMRLPFERIVDAHRLVDTGHKVGSLVLSME